MILLFGLMMPLMKRLMEVRQKVAPRED